MHIYGPYLRRFPPIPVGPNIGATGVNVTNNSSFNVVENMIGGTVGWVYNHETGNIMANTDDLDDQGRAYNTY